jgi:hypothetical protein
MSNIFQEVMTDANGVQDKYLGPSYPYWQNIKAPSQLGMSDAGDLTTLGKDVNGLIQYVEVLVSGDSSASTTGGPLGNKFFLNTGGKCVANDTNQNVDRYIYINNVPQGNIPFVSSGMGTNFSDFRGLIPGTMSNLNTLNPFTIMQAFMSGATPPCQQVTLETIDVSNNVSTQTQYVSTVDLQNMDACSFQGGQNPVTGASCKESFQTLEPAAFPRDPLLQAYFAGLGMIGIYILYCMMRKHK